MMITLEKESQTVLNPNLVSERNAVLEREEWIKVCPKFQRMRPIQRVIDIVLSGAALLILAPLMFVVAIGIALDSEGPILFCQQRIGQNGRAFNLYKFRSMVKDAEQRKRMIQDLNERTGPVFKMRDDPRITRIGKILRQSSIDELPQLINVLRGDMSLVGPRPALPSEVVKYTAFQKQRLLITPGLTGLWQVSGRAQLSFEESIALDLAYIRNWSLSYNARIMLQTIPAVIRSSGAF